MRTVARGAWLFGAWVALVCVSYGTLIAWSRYDGLPALLWTMGSAGAVGVAIWGMGRFFPEISAEQDLAIAERALMDIEDEIETVGTTKQQLAAARARLRTAEDRAKSLRK